MENHYPKQNNETPIHITYVPNSKENVDYKLKAEYDGDDTGKISSNSYQNKRWMVFDELTL